MMLRRKKDYPDCTKLPTAAEQLTEYFDSLSEAGMQYCSNLNKLSLQTGKTSASKCAQEFLHSVLKHQLHRQVSMIARQCQRTACTLQDIFAKAKQHTQWMTQQQLMVPVELVDDGSH